MFSTELAPTTPITVLPFKSLALLIEEFLATNID